MALLIFFRAGQTSSGSPRLISLVLFLLFRIAMSILLYASPASALFSLAITPGGAFLARARRSRQYKQERTPVKCLSLLPTDRRSREWGGVVRSNEGRF